MHKFFIATLITALHTTSSSWATNIVLDLPIQCEINKECFIQNYVDQADGDYTKDYRCNNLSYNKHKGTDFTIRSQHLHDSPIPVIAAQKGIVLGSRDNKKDIHPKHASHHYREQSIKGMECGNGITLQHHDQWQTQYCHMKKGSIRVQKGQKVKKGQILGYVGHSGMADFPHLHLSVRHQNVPIDPFTGTKMESGCNARNGSLWSDSAQKQLSYPSTAILDFGIKNNLPINAISARMGEYRNEHYTPSTQASLIWIDILRPTKGDQIHYTLISPNGKKKEFSTTIQKTQARLFQYVGTKSLPLPQKNSRNMTYRISYKLMRDNTILDSRILRTNFWARR